MEWSQVATIGAVVVLVGLGLKEAKRRGWFSDPHPFERLLREHRNVYEAWLLGSPGHIYSLAELLAGHILVTESVAKRHRLNPKVTGIVRRDGLRNVTELTGIPEDVMAVALELSDRRASPPSSHATTGHSDLELTSAVLMGDWS